VVFVWFAIGLCALAGAAAERTQAGARTVTAPAAQVFVAPHGSDSANCRRMSPCASFNRAYHLAAAGQTIEVAAGEYVLQRITPDPSKAQRRRVLFRPAAGAAVRVDGLDSTASNVEFRGLTLNGSWVVQQGGTSPGASGVTFRNIRAHGFYVIGPVSDISVIGGSYGPMVDNHPMIAPTDLGSPVGPANILIDGVLFHDFTRSGPAVHTECLQAYGAHGLIIRRSRFTNCDGTGDVGIGSIGTYGLEDVLFENNWLDSKGDAYWAIQTSNASGDITFRYNSSLKGIAVNKCPGGCTGRVTLVGNYMPFSGCVDGVTYQHNVFSGGACDRTDIRVAKLDFVDAAAFNLRLKPGANAICRGDPHSIPVTDIEGKKRSTKRPPDAGASYAVMTGQPRSILRRCGVSAKKTKRSHGGKGSKTKPRTHAQ
jgi:hypothetical protein